MDYRIMWDGASSLPPSYNCLARVAQQVNAPLSGCSI